MLFYILCRNVKSLPYLYFVHKVWVWNIWFVWSKGNWRWDCRLFIGFNAYSLGTVRVINASAHRPTSRRGPRVKCGCADMWMCGFSKVVKCGCWCGKDPHQRRIQDLERGGSSFASPHLLSPSLPLSLSLTFPPLLLGEPGRQTLSGAFSAYLGAFWQAFSSNLSLVKLQLLTPPQFFSDFSFQKCDASADAYLTLSYLRYVRVAMSGCLQLRYNLSENISYWTTLIQPCSSSVFNHHTRPEGGVCLNPTTPWIRRCLERGITSRIVIAASAVIYLSIM